MFFCARKRYVWTVVTAIILYYFFSLHVFAWGSRRDFYILAIYVCKGGGILKLVARKSLILEGQILANGLAGVAGGSGGSIWLDVLELEGSGSLSVSKSGICHFF